MLVSNEEITTALKSIDALFVDESVWTQNASARNAHGDRVTPDDKTAVRWCLLGGISKVCCMPYSELKATISMLFHRYAGLAMSVYNDTHTFSQVKALIAAFIDAHAAQVSDG